MSNYRQDARTDQEFADDILECTKIESVLMKAYVDDLSKRTKKLYTFADNGFDNTGKLEKDSNKITSDADFILYTPTGKKHLIEIKFSRPDVSRFHLKASQLDSYIKQDCCIVMFMGINNPQYKYTIITPDKMIWIKNNCEKHCLWYKDVYRIKNKDLEWFQIN